jgi:hypothetical protein
MQDFSVTALLPDLPPSVERTIGRHTKWTTYHGGRCYAVRVRSFGLNLDSKGLWRLLKQDGEARYRPWDIVLHASADETPGEQCDNWVPWGIFEEIATLRSPGTLQDFVIKFRSESEAMRFWRTWHKRPIPGAEGNAAGLDLQEFLFQVELIPLHTN